MKTALQAEEGRPYPPDRNGPTGSHLPNEHDDPCEPVVHRNFRGRGARLREWLAGKRPFGRLLQPPCVSGAGDLPGLVMLKIDGLSYYQLQRAFANGRLPYLLHLATGGHYTLKPLYSGIPSATPAVQGELFFGVKSSVPAVSFFDRKRHIKMNMLFPSSADAVARQLVRQGRPLLEGGRSYSNIYIGGVEEARYCAQTMRLRSFRQVVSSVKLFAILMLQPVKFLKMLSYGLLEVGLAFYDFIIGVAEGKNFLKELKFVPTRVLISILLRELIRTRAKMDVARGVRIVHASFLGYDEQAHRRGPGSAFAHWSLKGIDDVIRDIHQTAAHSKCRRYRLVVYADHGQEEVLSYEKHVGLSLEESVTRAIRKVNGEEQARRDGGRNGADGMGPRRVRSLLWQGSRADRHQKSEPISTDGTLIAALGPLGHIYFGQPPAASKKAQVAETLVRIGQIPLALYAAGHRVVALTPKGTFDLENDAAAILGADHPFADLTAQDLAATCRHPDAGDIVISGWAPDAPPLTFAVENGAHGGPGREETRAFVLLPPEMDTPAAVLRPSDLRDRVLAMFPGGDAGQPGETV